MPISMITINHMPAEVLVRIFTALPWRDRLLGIERVSRAWRRLALARGWEDVRHFDETLNEFHSCWYECRINYHGTLARHLVSRGPLLTRVGPHLMSLVLCRGLDDTVWLSELARCPNLKHLSLQSLEQLSADAIDQIRRDYGSSLKTLRMADYGGFEQEVAGAWALLFNDLLRCGLNALECLQIECAGDDYISELSLRALSHYEHYEHLRHCTLKYSNSSSSNTTALLNETNLGMLSTLPTLKSLTIDAEHPIADFTFLQNFFHLEHIAMGIDFTNLSNFSKVLPHLAKQGLKALEVLEIHRTRARGLMKELVAVVTANLPLLEHLGVKSANGFDNSDEDGEERDYLGIMGWLEQLTCFPHLERLVSLELGFNLPKEGDWGWLERISERLEYLALPSAPPLSTICTLLKRSKNLCGMRLDGFYGPPSEELVRTLVEALASENDATSHTSTNNQLQQSSDNTLSLLFMPLKRYNTRLVAFRPHPRHAHHSLLSSNGASLYRSEEVVVTQVGGWPNRLPSIANRELASPSHVLLRYKYGEELSEGARFLESNIEC